MEIRVSPERLRNTAARLENQAGETDDLLRSMMQIVGGLDAEWAGAAQAEYTGHFIASVSRMRGQIAHILDALIRDLRHIADEFERVDREAVARTGPQPVPTPTPAPAPPGRPAPGPQSVPKGQPTPGTSQQGDQTAGGGPLTAKDAAHKLEPADPSQYDPHTGCVSYATARRPDLRVTDAPIPGAADYIPYYEQKGKVMRVQEADQDLRQKVKPGYAVVWPRGHPDLVGTPGGQFGHVAIVEEVGPDYVIISQAGWPGKPTMKLTREQLKSLYLIV